MIFFFSIRVFFTDTDDSEDSRGKEGTFFTDTDDSENSRGKEGTIFYSTLPLPPAREH